MDKRIAIVEKYPTGFNYASVFNFEYELHSLVEERQDKVLKRDITIDIDVIIEEYDYIILVGAEPCKFVGKISSVTQYQGYLIEDKFIPLMNPMAVKMRPSAQYDFDDAVASINSIVNGQTKKLATSYDIKGITTKEDAIKHIKFLLDMPELTHVAWDTETTALYPRDGYVLGISLSYTKEQGVYIDSMCIDGYLVIGSHEQLPHNIEKRLEIGPLSYIYKKTK